MAILHQCLGNVQNHETLKDDSAVSHTLARTTLRQCSHTLPACDNTTAQHPMHAWMIYLNRYMKTMLHIPPFMVHTQSPGAPESDDWLCSGVPAWRVPAPQRPQGGLVSTNRPTPDTSHSFCSVSRKDFSRRHLDGQFRSLFFFTGHWPPSGPAHTPK